MVSARAKDAVRGPLVPHADGLAAALAAGGYTSATQTKYHRLLIELSGWLARRGIDGAGCTEETLERYVAARRAGGHAVAVSVAGLGPLLGYLRDRAAIPPAPPPPPDPVAPVLGDYRRYLERERRLAPLTVTTALGVVRRFLVDRRIVGAAGLAWLTVDDVHAFVLTEANRLKHRRDPGHARRAAAVSALPVRHRDAATRSGGGGARGRRVAAGVTAPRARRRERAGPARRL